MDIRPLTGALGAEILGADIRRPEHFDRIRAAFADHSVIVLRGQEITPEDHLAFARRFGTINVNRFFKPVDGHPEIATVLKEKDQKEAVGEGWHNYHHTFPWDYKAGEFGWKINLTTIFIDLMALLGLASDRKVVPKATIKARKLRTGPVAAAVGYN